MEVLKNAAASVTTAYSKVSDSLKQEGGLKGWFKNQISAAKTQYAAFVNSFKNFSDVNMKLGLLHLDRGNYYDARFRFRLVSLFCKNRPEINYYMGRAYYEDSKPAKAKTYIEKYLESEDEPHLLESVYTLKLINKEKDIDSIPYSLTGHFFDLLSPVYDAVYLDYDEAPQYIIFKSLNKFISTQSKQFGNITLDLGCGTGIMGYLSRSAKISSEIIGIDISKMMIEATKSLNVDTADVYSSTEHKDAISYLTHVPPEKKFNLIYAVNMINYLGSLDELFTKVYQTLDVSGIFVILFTSHEGNDNYTFDTDLEYFSHNSKFVEELCTKLNFKTIEQSAIKQTDGSQAFYMIMQK